MNQRRFILNFLIPIAALLAIGCASCVGSTNSFSAYERPVMTWVPRYAANNSQQRLSETYSGIGMKDALTHVGLQFWTPTNKGGLIQTGKGATTSDAVIKSFRDWCRTNSVRVLLCVYQIGDCELALSAFKDNCGTFIESLLTEVNRHDLDGVDIYFEGRGRLNEDKEGFRPFHPPAGDKITQRQPAPHRGFLCLRLERPQSNLVAQSLPARGRLDHDGL